MLTFHSQQEVESNFLATGQASMDVALYRGDVTDELLDDAVTRARMSSALMLEVHIPRTKLDMLRPVLDVRGFKVIGYGTTYVSPRYEYIRFGLRLRGQEQIDGEIHPRTPIHPRPEGLLGYEQDAIAAMNLKYGSAKQKLDDQKRI
jgi:hypothetical protein